MHSDSVVQAAAAAAAVAHASRARQSQQQSDDTRGTPRTSSSSTDNSAGLGTKNIGTFVVNGEDMDDKISMEELLSLLGVGFGRRHHHHHIVLQNLGFGLGIGGTGRASDIAVGIHLIMPWLLALLFGVVIPAILAVIGRIRQRRGRMYYNKLSSKEKRLFRLIQCFGRFKKTIREKDIVDAPKKMSRDVGIGGDNGASSSEKDDDDNNDDGGDDKQTTEEDRLLKIPRAGSPLLPSNSQLDNSSMQTMRQVPAICTICLDPYKAGEIVVWSSNSKCMDHFHEHCIVAWLSKRRGGSDARCPCCRQHFIDDIFRAQAGLNSK